MSESEFVGKSSLVDQINFIANSGKTGYLTILTNNRRSVLLCFFQGKLTQARARSRDVADAIDVLNSCDLVKFTYTDTKVKNFVEIMQIDVFLQMISLSMESGKRSLVLSSTRQPVSNDAKPAVSSTMISLLSEVAASYIGPIADMVVQDAVSESDNFEEIVENIANTIPDVEAADKFKSEALSILYSQ